MLKTVGLSLFAMLAAASAGHGQDAVEVFQKVSPSVVSLSNLEGGGAGIVLDESGLILTNAHVVASMLPFKCVAEVAHDGSLQQVTFGRVQVVGMHPTMDLALVRINPGEHQGALVPATITRGKATPGQRVYAIGNPAAGQLVLNKTITAGLISGVDRELEGVTYYQVDAAINPGNSGGPIVNSQGEVLGIATLKFEDVDNVGFAIPMYSFENSEFKPPEDRAGNPQMARQFVDQAKSFAQRASTAQRRQPGDPGAESFYAMAARSYHEALTYDPSNWTIYYNCGLMLGNLNEPEVAAAYMLQAIEVSPWDHQSDFVYRQLGIYLQQQGKQAEAAAAWQEGLTKYPQSGYCWEFWAKHCAQQQDHYAAAYAAAVVLHLQPRNSDQKEMQRIKDAAMQQLDAAQKSKLDGVVASMRSELTDLAEKAAESKRGGQTHLNTPFQRLVASNGNLRRDAEQPGDTELNPASEQPEIAAGRPQAKSPAATFRFWVDASGDYQVEARFVEMIDNIVRLEKKSGGIVDVPMEKLSAADQAYLKRTHIDK